MDQIRELNQQEHWTEVIEPASSLMDLKLKEVWRYRDLLFLLVRRDFVALYKQTVLGPIWFFLQPILTTITFTVIFNNIAKIPIGNTPPVLFYLAGTTLWNYFSECLTKTATVFRDNAAVFGKVYFPRLVMPLSIIVSNLVKLGIQFLLFLLVWTYYFFTQKAADPHAAQAAYTVHPNSTILLLPVLIILMGGLGLGFGMIISAMTTKYRDLIFLLTFGVQLLMYATPIIYPLSFPQGRLHTLILANPMSSIIETFRYSFLGVGTFSWQYLSYSALFTLVIVLLGTVIFNKVEKSFMDTV